MQQSRHVYIIRHPQTEYNQQNRFQGLSDSPITAEGLISLNKTAEFFSKKSITTIYSSPLKRCKFSSYVINNKIEAQLIFDDRLKEICYGDWEEKTKEEIGYDNIKKERGKNRFTYVHPGSYKGIRGESYQMLYKRLIPLWEEMINLKKGNVLIIGHVGVMISAKKFFESMSDEEIAEYRPKNMEILDYEVV